MHCSCINAREDYTIVFCCLVLTNLHFDSKIIALGLQKRRSVGLRPIGRQASHELGFGLGFKLLAKGALVFHDFRDVTALDNPKLSSGSRCGSDNS